MWTVHVLSALFSFLPSFPATDIYFTAVKEKRRVKKRTKDALAFPCPFVKRPFFFICLFVCLFVFSLQRNKQQEKGKLHYVLFTRVHNTLVTRAPFSSHSSQLLFVHREPASISLFHLSFFTVCHYYFLYVAEQISILFLFLSAGKRVSFFYPLLSSSYPTQRNTPTSTRTSTRTTKKDSA